MHLLIQVILEGSWKPEPDLNYLKVIYRLCSYTKFYFKNSKYIQTKSSESENPQYLTPLLWETWNYFINKKYFKGLSQVWKKTLSLSQYLREN